MLIRPDYNKISHDYASKKAFRFSAHLMLHEKKSLKDNFVTIWIYVFNFLAKNRWPIAGAGTKIFGFSTNAAACDYGHSKATWIDADTWDYSQFEKRAEAVLAVKPDALLLTRVNQGTPR